MEVVVYFGVLFTTDFIINFDYKILEICGY